MLLLQLHTRYKVEPNLCFDHMTGGDDIFKDIINGIINSGGVTRSRIHTEFSKTSRNFHGKSRKISKISKTILRSQKSKLWDGGIKNECVGVVKIQRVTIYVAQSFTMYPLLQRYFWNHVYTSLYLSNTVILIRC